MGSNAAILRITIMHDLGKMLFLLGVILVVAGGILWKTGGLGGLGQLPGDLFVRKGNSTFYFPIVTCILISVILTLLSWLFRR
jgi:hypothetical protein